MAEYSNNEPNIIDLQKEKWCTKYKKTAANDLDTEEKEIIADTSWRAGFDSAVAIIERMKNEEILDWQNKLIQSLNYTNSILKPKLN